jgi:hypothetical protein
MLSAQVGQDWGWVMWILFIIIFPLIYPWLTVQQILFRLNRVAHQLEGMSMTGKKAVLRRVAPRPGRKLRQKVTAFFEFFIIHPVSLDPYGIIRKLEHIMLLSESKFKRFVAEIAPQLDTESQANLVMGLSAAITLHQLAKLVRHYVELIRKTKSMHIALLIQMQLPLIQKLSQALLTGAKAMIRGWPVGDSIGALCGARLIGRAKTKEIVEDTVVARRRIAGRRVAILKAKGPGGRIGKLGRAVEKLVKRRRIAKIIMIDAAVKLEGERTGSVAQGVGVALGGIGVDRAYIEAVAVKKSIPLDSVIIKMSREEALQPMHKDVLASSGQVVSLIEMNIQTTPEPGEIVVVGVGNTVGVGNNAEAARRAEKLIRKVLRRIRREREARRRKRFKIWPLPF